MRILKISRASAMGEHIKCGFNDANRRLPQITQQNTEENTQTTQEKKHSLIATTLHDFTNSFALRYPSKRLFLYINFTLFIFVHLQRCYDSTNSN